MTDLEKRIIPTRVGTRANVEYNFTSGEDHPHACGDKYRKGVTVFVLWGSSPRVWGQAPLFSPPCNIFRIIPTRVGTSALCTSSCEDTKDHPHACGDKASGHSFFSHLLLSSPRVWGQGYHHEAAERGRRIIPTRVGTRKGVKRRRPHF